MVRVAVGLHRAPYRQFRPWVYAFSCANRTGKHAKPPRLQNSGDPLQLFRGQCCCRKPLWKMMFGRHSQSPSQNGNMDATGIGKVEARTNLAKGDARNEGASDEGADCSARSARTADC